ncbi:peptidoglycan-binding domain-containing protein [Bacillus stercoris]|uniref:peptidoglycan-binding domain-containing protein n=1 Tax=Bacillus stercoris TaxID=2054641 RepID=UPI003CEDD5DD
MNHLICVNLPIQIICLETDDTVRRFQLMNGLNPDGIYGPKTADAIRRFQLMHGLSADGIYGSKTKGKLEALLRK